MREAATNIITYRPGLRAYTTPRGIRVIEIDYWANPDHPENGEWANAQRRLTATDRDWRREMERDWSSPAGDPLFPEFSEIGAQAYIHVATKIITAPPGRPPLPVYRSYDLGERRPACVWYQYSPISDRFWFYREFMPHDLGTHHFRDAVRYLSGEIPATDLDTAARKWVDAYAAKPTGAHCPPPWFPVGTRFVDVSGKECLQRDANVINPEEKTAIAIFAAAGMYLLVVNPRVAGRNRVMRRFLKIRPDGHPGILIDPQMSESIEGWSGGWSYGPTSKDGVISDRARDDGHYINLCDAWGYGVSAVAPEDAPPPQQEPRQIGFERDGRTPRMSNPADADSLDLYETRRS